MRLKHLQYYFLIFVNIDLNFDSKMGGATIFFLPPPPVAPPLIKRQNPVIDLIFLLSYHQREENWINFSFLLNLVCSHTPGFTALHVCRPPRPHHHEVLHATQTESVH